MSSREPNTFGTYEWLYSWLNVAHVLAVRIPIAEADISTAELLRLL